MSKAIGPQKHLTLDERKYIEEGLDKNLLFKEIAKFLDKDPSTISKEVRKHMERKEPGSNNYGFNKCFKRQACRKRNICNSNCNRDCRTCKLCNEKCSEFDEGICSKLRRPPYVCNGCEFKVGCRRIKYIYRAYTSFNEYKTTLTSSREGINLTPEELDKLDNLISPLISRGQSISHIYLTQRDKIHCTKQTLYNYIDKNYLSVCNLDLPRRVRYKKRKSDNKLPKDTTIRKGRTYEDFLKYCEENPELPIVEMDTVEGKKGGKVLLTLFFRSSKLMLAFLLKQKTSLNVLKVFDFLENILGNDLFEETFPIILTDNGTEFSNPLALEFNSEGIGRTRVFFCNPTASYQKGMLEKNHEYIRYVIPKGISMDDYTQSSIVKMINHINSTARKSLNGHTPYELSKILIDEDVLKKLNLKVIPAIEVQLNTKLLKKI
jgi:IS30 family transposase